MASEHTEKSKLVTADSLAEKPKDTEGPRTEEQEQQTTYSLPAFCQFPISVYFIIANEFCERFNYFGVRTILTLYLMKFIGLGPNHATAIFHLFVVLCYFSPLLGGVVADSLLGRFWTICALSVVYCVGGVVLAATAVPQAGLAGALTGLLLIGVGTGGIKPNVCAFGAEQIPADDHRLRDAYFSTFYFFINFGSLVATALIPVVRSHVQCMGDSCYALAFGIPAAAMLLSLLVFVAGRRRYRSQQPGGSIVTQSARCVASAVRNYRAAGVCDPDRRLLDYADSEQFSPEFVRDLRQLGRLVVLYAPFPIFWALFDQMGSRWTIQASLMDGYLGAGLSVLPDQMQGLNALLILFLIPLFDCCVYPLLGRTQLSASLLRRIGAGMVLASAAFVAAMLVQLQIEADLPVTPARGQMKVKFVNAFPNCNVAMSFGDQSRMLAPLSFSDDFITSAKLSLDVSASSDDCNFRLRRQLRPDSANSSYDLLAYPGAGGSPRLAPVAAETEKHKKGLGLVRLLLTSSRLHRRLLDSSLVLTRRATNATFAVNATTVAFAPAPELRVSAYAALHSGFYSVRLLAAGRPPAALPSVSVKNGQILTLVLFEKSDEKSGKNSVAFFVVEEVRANSVKMLWQIPQYVLISLAEVLFAVSGLALSYAEAPASMKSLVQALWLLCVAIGNVVVMVVSETRLAHYQSYEFLMFAAVMLLNVLLFAVLSSRYRPFATRHAEVAMEARGDAG